MHADALSRRTRRFVNVAHALDHFVLLIFPTAVLAIAAERGLDYGALIGLATGAFVAFGLFSLPMGWIAERTGRRALLAAFFLGSGACCLGLALSTSSIAIALWLTALGAFAAIYHPIGSAMLIAHSEKLGRDLGWNGVWGNLGAASASGVTALIAATFGWRWGFAAPGLVAIAIGVAFLALVPGDGEARDEQKSTSAQAGVVRPKTLIAIFALAIVAGGLTFNMTTIALPKVIDERLGFDLPLALVGSLATAVFVVGALTQLLMGRLIDRIALPTIFVGLSLLQPIGLGLAAVATGAPMLLGLALAMSAIYGQVIINDAMVARYVAPAWRAKAFSVRYFLGFTTAGFAAPLIAALHGAGGFPLTLAVAAGFGAAIVSSAIAFFLVARPAPAAAPAE